MAGFANGWVRAARNLKEEPAFACVVSLSAAEAFALQEMRILFLGGPERCGKPITVKSLVQAA
jgi:hypothetical protein